MCMRCHYICPSRFSASPVSQTGLAVGHSSRADDTRLFIRDKILLKNSQNLSSANSVLRRVRPVDVECFPPTWPRIKHVFTCLYSKESLKKPLAHTTKDSVISITVTSSDKKLWWTVPFHHIYIRIKVTLPNDFLPSVASFNALFRQDHRFLNIFLL